MKTVIRKSYKPKLGDYCNTLVIDDETGNQYLFDGDGVWTLISTDEEGIIAEAVAQANAYTDDVAEEKVDKEEGKGLSENDFTDALKDKLDSVEEGAQENVIEVIKRNGATLPVVDKTVDIAVPTTTSALTNDSGYITSAVDDLVNYYDKDETDTIVETEALTRDAADQDLQEQIDAIVASSDVVDIVGTYAELQNYDTSKLHDNDIIKVLTDETRDDATTYYRWDDATDTFTYIGSEGPYYTKGEADATFVPLTRTINGKGLNSDVVLTASDVGALPSSTVIPTVNDATLTIQKNGSTVQTFTANQATNATANITVPTKTSDLTNDGSDNTSTYVESDELAAVATSGSYNDLTDKPTIDFELVEMSYGESDAWAKFIAAYQGHKIVYCRASSNSNPATGTQGRKAFMAYVNNAENPTEVEFQYVRSVSTKTSSQPVDQVFIYKLTNANGGTWSVQTRDMGPKLAQGTNTTVSYSNGTYTISATQPTVNDATLTIKKNGSSVGTFTANSSTNTDVDITVPTKTSDLTNDSGFIDKNVSDLTNYYDETTVNSMFNALTIPTKTSDLTNDSGFITNTDYASANTGGVVKVGSGLSIDANGVLSSSGLTSVDWSDVTNKPTNVSYWTNDAGYITSAAVPTKTSDLTNDSGFITSASVPTKTSDLTNDSGFITSSVNNLANYYKKSETYTQGEVNSLINAIVVPTKTSDLVNDGSDGTAQYLETDETAYKTASIPYGQCDSTSTSTVFTATVPGVTELRDGVCMWLKNGVVTSASGFTININGLGAKPVYNNMAAATRDTTIWNINYTMFFVYDSTRVSGGCWILYRGYNSDNNTIGYQLRTNSTALTTTDRTRYYRLLFTSADNTHWIPANTQYDNSATSNKTVNQRKINPFGRIVYLGNSTSYLADATVTATAVWDQYAFNLGYSFSKGSALTMTYPKPVYIKCAPQSDGSAIIDSTTPYVQDLPSAEDGKIYIYLGIAYSATNVEMVINHPIYYYKDGAIREWSNAPAAIASVAWGDITGTLSSQTDLNTALGAKANSADLATVATSGSYADLTDKPTIPTVNNATLTIQKNSTNVATFTANAASNVTANISVPTATSDLTNDSGFLTNSTLPVATSNSLGVVQVGSGLAVSSGGVLSATGGGVADSVAWGHVTGTLADQTDLQDELDAKANTADLATVATSGSYNDLTNKPTIGTGLLTLKNNNVVIGTFSANSTSGSTITVTTPTKTSDLTNDSGFITSYTETDPIYSASAAAGITSTDITNWNNKSDFSGSYTDLTNKPTIGNATLTIQKNGTSAGTFTANATSNKTINITVPTTAADVSALPASTKYGASIAVSINTTDYKVTTTLKDQDGNTLGTAQVIDLPLESVVVNGSYDSTNKKIVLTLQNGNTIDIPVADLVAGLQSEITSTNKLASDLVDDTGQTNKFMTSAEKTKLSGIAAGAEVNVQSDWNQTTTTADDYIKNKPSLATVATSGSYNDLSDKPTIPTVNNATLTIQKNGTNVQTFTANQSTNATANITVPTTVLELSDSANYATTAALASKQDTLIAGDHIDITSNTISATDYVHSEQPVSTTAVTPVVTNDMIADGTITADKLASGATVKLTLSTSDIGEGAALAANTLYGVYI